MLLLGAAFPWQELPDDSLVVDVGGGIGSTAMLLAHTFPHLRFVIQDRPQVAEQGVAVCASASLQAGFDDWETDDVCGWAYV